MPQIPVADVSNTGSEYVELVRADTISHDPRFHDVRITAPGATGIMARIELDGVPLRGVKSYSVRVGVDDANEVTVTFIAGSVNRENADAIDARSA